VTQVSIVAATVEQLEALTRDPAEFADVIGAPVPAGWPKFGESVGFTHTGEVSDDEQGTIWRWRWECPVD
jgi:hypothetical protein